MENDLRRNSALFWLVVLIAVGIIFVGARFLVAPSAGAAGFGVPAGPSGALMIHGGTAVFMLALAAALWPKSPAKQAWVERGQTA